MLALDVGYSIAKLPQGAIFYAFLHFLGKGLVPTLDVLVLYSIILMNKLEKWTKAGVRRVGFELMAPATTCQHFEPGSVLR